MKKLFLSVLLAVSAAGSLAQADKSAGGLDAAAERTRIANERAVLDRTVAAERAACYQKFAVQSCLEESQQRRRTQTDDLKRQEAQLNNAERKQRGAVELQRLEGLQKDADDAAQKAGSAREAQQQRDQRASDSANSRASAASAASANARQFENKQRDFAKQQSDAAARAAQAPAERERYERKLQQAAEHQAALEKRRAERDKPRSAGLPSAP
jgi:colicin import membrane protein